jgi:hypothetical protein
MSGLIVSIVIGSLSLLLGIGIILCLILLSKRKARQRAQQQDTNISMSTPSQRTSQVRESKASSEATEGYLPNLKRSQVSPSDDTLF